MYTFFTWRIVPGGAIIAVWWRSGCGVGAPGGRVVADPAAARTRGTDPGRGRVVEWRGGGSRWGERRTSVGGVSRFLGVRAAAASAVEVGLGRGGGGGAGLGRASRLNVLNGLRRRRLYACGPLSISPKTPRSRATGARERAHPKTNADQTFFCHPPPPPPPFLSAESSSSSNQRFLCFIIIIITVVVIVIFFLR